MACSGIAVLTAQTPDVNMAEHMEDEANRAAFLEFLREQGVEFTSTIWRINQLALSNSMVFQFGTTGVRVTGSRYTSSNEDRAKLLLAVQQYAASVNQANILDAIQQVGFNPQDFSYDTAGALSFTIEIGA